MSRALELLFVVDPVEALVLETETTLLLVEEAGRRGHDVAIAYVPDLYLRDREARARTHGLELGGEGEAPRRVGEPRDRALASFDLVLMRKDPPVDVEYHNALTVLAPAREEVPVVNDPVGLAISNEKLLPLEIPGAAPPSIVTADPDVIAAFAREHEDVVVKPLNQFSGYGIARLTTRDSALDPGAIGALAAQDGRHVMVQRFLPEVARGDKRVFVVAGDPLGWVNRVPQPGSFRANIHQGARVEATELTDREREIVAAAAPILSERGLELAGFDFIGGWLTEINVTSPSALRQIDRVMGERLERPLLDWIEARAEEGVRTTLPG
ncbi:MAG: glutathione synthase [Gemmatimonadota bacterium]|nr:glutathione synthase [Gemmatimonadota bacterium]